MLFSHTGFGGGNYEGALYWLKDFGIIDVIIPFALIFTIMFAVLQKVKVFSDKKFNAVIAVCISLITVIPHVLHLYPNDYDVITILNSALPEVSLVAIAIVLFLILTGLMVGKQHGRFRVVRTVAPWVALGLILFIFSRAIFSYRVPEWLRFLDNPALGTTLVMILVSAVVIALVVGGKGTGTGTGSTTGSGLKSLIEFVKKADEDKEGEDD